MIRSEVRLRAEVEYVERRPSDGRCAGRRRTQAEQVEACLGRVGQIAVSVVTLGGDCEGGSWPDWHWTS